MATSKVRYSPEEDQRILSQWWNPELRDQIMRDFGRTRSSINFRYYALLKNLGIEPKDHRVRHGVIPVGHIPNKEEDIETSLADKIEEIETDLSALKEYVSQLERRVSFQGLDIVKASDSDVSKRLSEIYTEYKLQVEKNNRMYQELDHYLGEFFKLNNFEKMTSLNDFLPKMKTVLDKYGESKPVQLTV